MCSTVQGKRFKSFLRQSRSHNQIINQSPCKGFFFYLIKHEQHHTDPFQNIKAINACAILGGKYHNDLTQDLEFGEFNLWIQCSYLIF